MIAAKLGGVGLLTLIDGWTLAGWFLLSTAIVLSAGMAISKVHRH